MLEVTCGGRAVTELGSKGVVVHRLHYRPRAVAGLRHLTDIAQVVLVVVQEGEIVLRGIILCGLAIAFLKLIFVYPAIFQH